jgi:hypothetical protein
VPDNYGAAASPIFAEQRAIVVVLSGGWNCVPVPSAQRRLAGMRAGAARR